MSVKQAAGSLLQRDYYARTAAQYDDLQIRPDDEHAIALAWMVSLAEQRGYVSILDVGSGTGRALAYIKRIAGARVVGIEPSEPLRQIGYAKGLRPDELVDGDALNLAYDDNSFDVVCAYGVLHHIKDHQRAVAEMTRVAKRAVFISDSNNFGQGALVSRIFKQGLNTLGLWRSFDFLRTGGKGYHYSDGDGVFYSYSLFKDLPIINSKFQDNLYMSTRPSGANLYRSAQTIAVHASNNRVK